MGILTARGPLHAPSLVWGACGGAVEPPSPRLPSGHRSQTSPARYGSESLAYDPHAAALADRPPQPRFDGSFGSRKQHREKRALLAESTGLIRHTHRLRVVHVGSHYRGDMNEPIRSGETEGFSAPPYAPVYFALPPSHCSNTALALRSVDKWDSARMLGKSRPVAAVLRAIEENRSGVSEKRTRRQPRDYPLFDDRGNLNNHVSAPVAAAFMAAAGGLGNPPLGMPALPARGSGSSRGSRGGHHQLSRLPRPVGYNPVYICDKTGSAVTVGSKRRNASTHQIPSTT